MSLLRSPIILFRSSLAEENELAVAKRHFDVVEQRAQLVSIFTPGLVIPRYSALPFYQELEEDIRLLGGELINSYHQHCYVADLANWYHDFEDLTPKTWFRPSDVPHDQSGSFVLKGATNSRKSLWRTHMLAADRASVMDVYCRLLDDTMLGQQGIYVRQFEEFVSFGEGLNGLPITKEYRFFILDGEIVGAGFYWSEHFEELCDSRPASVLRPPIQWVKDHVCSRLKMGADSDGKTQWKIRFAVVDVAQHVDGRWRIVEFNDGSMSGLSCVDAEQLYSNMWSMLGVNDVTDTE